MTTNHKAATFLESSSDNDPILAEALHYPSSLESEPLKTVHFPSIDNLSVTETCGTTTDVDCKEPSRHFSNETGNDEELLEDDSQQNKSQLSNHHLALTSFKAFPKEPLGFLRGPPTSDPSTLSHPLRTHKVQCLRNPKQDVGLPDHEQPCLSFNQVPSPTSSSSNIEILSVSTTDPDFFNSEGQVTTTKKKECANNVVSLRYLSNEFQAGREENQNEDENVKELFDPSLGQTKKTKDVITNIPKAQDLAENNISNQLLYGLCTSPVKTNSLTLVPAQDSSDSRPCSPSECAVTLGGASDSSNPTHSQDSSRIFLRSHFGATHMTSDLLLSTHSCTSSSVFSSTQYGPIISAAQSATLSYKGSGESSSTLSHDTSSAKHEQVQKRFANIVLKVTIIWDCVLSFTKDLNACVFVQS